MAAAPPLNSASSMNTLSLTYVEGALTTAINNYIVGGSAALSSILLPLVAAALTLWIVVYGFAVVRGEVQEPINLFAWKLLKIAIILAAASTSGYYVQWVVNGLRGLESGFQSGFTSGSGTIASAIDSAASLMNPIKNEYYQGARNGIGILGFPDLDYMFAWLLIVISQVVIFTAASIPYLMAKLVTALLFAIGPIFILASLFEPTRRFTEAWLTAVMTQIFTTTLIFAIFGFLPRIFADFIGKIQYGQAAADAGSAMAGALIVLVITLLLSWLTWNVSNLAAQLAGGASLGNPAGAAAQAVMNKLAFGGGKGGGKGGGSVSKK